MKRFGSAWSGQAVGRMADVGQERRSASLGVIAQSSHAIVTTGGGCAYSVYSRYRASAQFGINAAPR